MWKCALTRRRDAHRTGTGGVGGGADGAADGAAAPKLVAVLHGELVCCSTGCGGSPAAKRQDFCIKAQLRKGERPPVRTCDRHRPAPPGTAKETAFLGVSYPVNDTVNVNAVNVNVKGRLQESGAFLEKHSFTRGPQVRGCRNHIE